MRPEFESLPDYEQRRVLALRAWWVGLSEDQREAARRDRSKRTALAAVRRKDRVSLIDQILRMVEEGLTPEDIAARFGWTVRNLRKRCAAAGIPISSRRDYRRAPALWIHVDHFDALERLAADRGEDAGEALAVIVGFQLADDAAAARRDTRTVRKDAAA